MNRTPVVLIHGAWFHLSSWEHWAERFTSVGYDVHVPAWPGEAGSAAEGRRDPGAARDLGLEKLIAHYERFVRALDSPPVLIGHSLGGLMVQHLLSVGLGRAAVVLAPWPGDGLEADAARARLSSLVPNGSEDYEGFAQLPRSHFRHAVANAVGEDEAARLFERHAVPAPRRLLADLGLGNGHGHSHGHGLGHDGDCDGHGHDDGHRDGDGDGDNDGPHPVRLVVDTADTERGPLLLISGQEDRMVPDAVTRAAYKSYGDSTAVTDLKQFADRGHSLAMDSGWRTVADHVLVWLAANGVKAVAAQG